jgi:hypothetical protein
LDFLKTLLFKQTNKQKQLRVKQTLSGCLNNSESALALNFTVLGPSVGSRANQFRDLERSESALA